MDKYVIAIKYSDLDNCYLAAVPKPEFGKDMF